MNIKIRKILCVLLCGACLSGVAVTAKADTVPFTITSNSDTLSRKVSKSSVYYENRAYVTATYFSRKGTFQCMSACYDNPRIVSDDMYVSGDGGYTNENADAKANGVYHPTAPGGVMYYMSASSNSTGINMLGRFTP